MTHTNIFLTLYYNTHHIWFNIDFIDPRILLCPPFFLSMIQVVVFVSGECVCLKLAIEFTSHSWEIMQLSARNDSP